jgi:hypothetical protein
LAFAPLELSQPPTARSPSASSVIGPPSPPAPLPVEPPAVLTWPAEIKWPLTLTDPPPPARPPVRPLPPLAVIVPSEVAPWLRTTSWPPAPPSRGAVLLVALPPVAATLPMTTDAPSAAMRDAPWPPTAPLAPETSRRPSACRAPRAVRAMVPEPPPSASALEPPVVSTLPTRTSDPVSATSAPLPPGPIPPPPSRPNVVIEPRTATSPPEEEIVTGAPDCRRPPGAGICAVPSVRTSPLIETWRPALMPTGAPSAVIAPAVAMPVAVMVTEPDGAPLPLVVIGPPTATSLPVSVSVPPGRLGPLRPVRSMPGSTVSVAAERIVSERPPVQLSPEPST